MLYRGFGNNSFRYSWILRKRKGKKRPEGISRYPLWQRKISCLFFNEKPKEMVTYRDLERIELVAEIDSHPGRGQVGKSEMESFREQWSPSPSEVGVETFSGSISSGNTALD